MDENFIEIKCIYQRKNILFFYKNYLRLVPIPVLSIIAVLYLYSPIIYDSLTNNFSDRNLMIRHMFTVVFFALNILFFAKCVSILKRINSLQFKDAKVSINKNDFCTFDNLIISKNYIFFKCSGKVKVAVIDIQDKNKLEEFLRENDIEYRRSDSPFPLKNYVKNKY
ncbi:MAG: hypothetical protein RR441_07415 [Longicatena sp.]